MKNQAMSSWEQRSNTMSTILPLCCSQLWCHKLTLFTVWIPVNLFKTTYSPILNQNCVCLSDQMQSVVLLMPT